MTGPNGNNGNNGAAKLDPSALTTQQLLREIEGLRALAFSAIDKATEVTAERFNSVDTQFALVERQRLEQKSDTKAAVDAALAAAKEAVAANTSSSEKSITKSETATFEQLKQLNVTFTTANAGLLSNFNDLKDRVGIVESMRQGMNAATRDRREAKAESRLDLNAVVIFLGLVLAAVSFFLTSK
jgi:hypothetical protein